MKTKYLYESVSEPACDGEVTLITYDCLEESDYKELQSLSDKLWKILMDGYRGNAPGLTNIEDLLMKSNIVRVAFYVKEPVAAAFYSDYLGGNKLTYGGAVRGGLHELGKAAFQAIVQRDCDGIPNEYNWVEVSGPVETCFAQCKNSFNLPNKYAKGLLKKGGIKLLEDGFHYSRPIGPQHVVFTKTIYGLPSESILGDLTRQIMGQPCDDIEYCWKQIVASQHLSETYNHVRVLDENGNPRVRTFGMALIEHFDELYSEWGVREIPSATIKQLQETLKILSRDFPDDKSVQRAVSYGNSMLDMVEPLEFLPYALSKKVEKIKVA